METPGRGRHRPHLKACGRLVEAPRRAVRAYRRGGRRSYAVRKPKDYCISQPGDLVQVDTLELRPLPGVVLKHFTARAVICRWDVIEVHRRATASAATRFLDTLQQRLPFPLRALQVNGGSEPACGRQVRRRLRRGLPTAGVETVRAAAPRSPKLNGCVERAQRTHREEFYEVTECSLEIAALNQELQAWERVYNPPAAGRPPCVRTKPRATSLPTSFWPSGNPNQRRPSVTNLLDE